MVFRMILKFLFFYSISKHFFRWVDSYEDFYLKNYSADTSFTNNILETSFRQKSWKILTKKLKHYLRLPYSLTAQKIFLILFSLPPIKILIYSRLFLVFGNLTVIWVRLHEEKKFSCTKYYWKPQNWLQH